MPAGATGIKTRSEIPSVDRAPQLPLGEPDKARNLLFAEVDEEPILQEDELIVELADLLTL